MVRVVRDMITASYQPCCCHSTSEWLWHPWPQSPSVPMNFSVWRHHTFLARSVSINPAASWFVWSEGVILYETTSARCNPRQPLVVQWAHHWCCSCMQLPYERMCRIGDKSVQSLTRIWWTLLRASSFVWDWITVTPYFMEFLYNINQFQCIQNALDHVVCTHYTDHLQLICNAGCSLNSVSGTRLQCEHLKFDYTVNWCTLPTLLLTTH